MQETIPWSVPYLGCYGLPTKVGALGIQDFHHRPKCGRLHCVVWEAIRRYPLCNGPLQSMVGCCIRTIGGGCKGAPHEGCIADGFRLDNWGSWQLVHREGLAIGLTLHSKGSSSSNVLRRLDVVGQNVIGCTSPRTIVIGEQVPTDSATDLQHTSARLVDGLHP